MRPEQWQLLSHFKPDEDWGDPSRMDFSLLQELDHFRSFIDTPIHINCGTQGQHCTGSLHYEGRAVDVSFPEVALTDLFDVWISAQRFIGFRGIGLYPGWHLQGIVRGGMHLDNRPGNRALWLGTSAESGPSYLPLNKETLRLHRLI